MPTKTYYRQQFIKQSILSKHQPPGPFPFVLVLDHLKPTFNIGKIIRTANAFGTREVHLVGIPTFNIKPCKGTLRQTRTRQFESFAESFAALSAEGYELFALDGKGDRILGQEPLPLRTAFVIGHEQFGLSFDRAAFPEVRRMRIPQFGSVQSLNASVAASVACFEYLRQREFQVA